MSLDDIDRICGYWAVFLMVIATISLILM